MKEREQINNEEDSLVADVSEVLFNHLNFFSKKHYEVLSNPVEK